MRIAAYVGGVLVVSLALTGACARSRRNQLPQEGAQVAAQSQPLPVTPAVDELSPLDGDAADAQAVAPLYLYDELSTIFARHMDDCTLMSQASSAAMLKHKPRLERWAASISKLSLAQRSEQEEQLKKSEGPRMERFRDRLSEALRTCSAQLMPVLTELSQYGGGDRLQ
jgi:hypothetical protein